MHRCSSLPSTTIRYTRTYTEAQAQAQVDTETDTEHSKTHTHTHIHTHTHTHTHTHAGAVRPSLAPALLLVKSEDKRESLLYMHTHTLFCFLSEALPLQK